MHKPNTEHRGGSLPDKLFRLLGDRFRDAIRSDDCDGDGMTGKAAGIVGRLQRGLDSNGMMRSLRPSEARFTSITSFFPHTEAMKSGLPSPTSGCSRTFQPCSRNMFATSRSSRASESAPLILIGTVLGHQLVALGGQLVEATRVI